MRLVYWLVSFAVLCVGADGFNPIRSDNKKPKGADPCVTIQAKADHWKQKFENAPKVVQNETCFNEAYEKMYEEYESHLNFSRTRIVELEVQSNETNNKLILETDKVEEMKVRTHDDIIKLQATIVSLELSLEESESTTMELKDKLSKKLENIPKVEKMERMWTKQDIEENCIQKVKDSETLLTAEMNVQCNKLVEETRKLCEIKPIEKLDNICPKIKANYTQCKDELNSLQINIDKITEDLKIQYGEKRGLELELKVIKHELKVSNEQANKTTHISKNIKDKDIEIIDLKNNIKNITEILDSKEDTIASLEIVISELKNVQQENTNLKNEIANIFASAKKMEKNVTECAPCNLNSSTKESENIESMKIIISELKNDVKNKSYSITELRTQFDQYKSNSSHEVDKYHGMYLEEKWNRLKCVNRGPN